MSSKLDKLALVIMVSGGGSTACRVIQACNDGRLRGARVALVIASTPKAGGIEAVQNLGIPKKDVCIIDPTRYGDNSEAFGEQILTDCELRDGDFLAQCGWLPWTPEHVIQHFRLRSLNQHGGPLDPPRPDFGGIHGKQISHARIQFLRDAHRPPEDWWTEATTQRVHEKFDKGAVLRRQRILVIEGHDAASLQKDLLPVERDLVVATIADFLNDTMQDLPLRDEPLVHKHEIPYLKAAKKAARERYPDG